jgi:hypothetical protein
LLDLQKPIWSGAMTRQPAWPRARIVVSHVRADVEVAHVQLLSL